MATKTRKAIKESFLKLASRKPVDKITVKEIVEDCGINRNSFYYHFQDLPDLIEKTLEDEMQQMVEMKDSGSLLELVHTGIRSMEEHQSILRNIYYSRNRSILEVHFLHLSDTLIRNYLNSHRFGELDITDEDREAIIRVYKWDAIGLVVDWMNNGLKFDLEKEFDRIYRMRQGTMKIMISRALAAKKAADEQARKKSGHH